MNWTDKSILITGGTGSIGNQIVKLLLEKKHPRKIIIYSRDELKQYDMRRKFSDSRLRFFIGDVRDLERTSLAMADVDIVIHAAALKQVPTCEYNPMEAVKTNIIGTANVLNAALSTGVSYVMALSTDKAVNPANLYGATKLVLEKLVINSNFYAGCTDKIFACVRYGNVTGSRGSVLPLFLKQKDGGTLTLTDNNMTRFWITLEQASEFILSCIEIMTGGEIFVPKLPSIRIGDLAVAIAPTAKLVVTGIRPGEKVQECLVSPDEAWNTLDLIDRYVIVPTPEAWFGQSWRKTNAPVPVNFSYTSDKNSSWLNVVDLANYMEQEYSQ